MPEVEIRGGFQNVVCEKILTLDKVQKRLCQCTIHVGQALVVLKIYGSEILTLGKNEERVVNTFETSCWRRIIKIKCTDKIINDEVFKG